MTDDGFNCPVCGSEHPSYKGYGQHYSRTTADDHNGHPLVALVGKEELTALYQTYSVNKLAEILPASRRAITAAIKDLDTVEYRDQSAAETKKWQQMDKDERQAQVRAAHEKTRELVENGDHVFRDLWDERPEEMQHRAEEAAALGADARDENGMSGVTGQDHPRWRGGKGVYDAVKKQVGRRSWPDIADDARAGECFSCGREDPEVGDELDVHHIIPIMAGGTHGDYNLMTLCSSCHREIEARTRSLFDPVLTE